MAFKVLTLLALTLAVAAAAVQPIQEVALYEDDDNAISEDIQFRMPRGVVPKDQSITIGAIYAGYDRQLILADVTKKATFLTVNSLNLIYPQPGQPVGTISCIQIVDRMKTGKNAVATVQSGGIGQRTVNIRFKSQRGEPINYFVVIWGH